VPKAAPEPLRLVQRFVNTIDREHGREWLADDADLAEFFGRDDHGVSVEDAHALRDALCRLLAANNGMAVDADSLATFNAAADRVVVRLDDAGAPELDGADPLGSVVAVAFRAMLDGTWSRLKTCRNCTWAFYDYSRNRSAGWCSMQLCGNRAKTRAYRRRQSA
jgi:predicted RNA-binding Zn ribbon-like protein